MVKCSYLFCGFRIAWMALWSSWGHQFRIWSLFYIIVRDHQIRNQTIWNSQGQSTNEQFLIQMKTPLASWVRTSSTRLSSASSSPIWHSYATTSWGRESKTSTVVIMRSISILNTSSSSNGRARQNPINRIIPSKLYNQNCLSPISTQSSYSSSRSFLYGTTPPLDSLDSSGNSSHAPFYWPASSPPSSMCSLSSILNMQRQAQSFNGKMLLFPSKIPGVFCYTTF